jgi:hypothetical protein
MHLPSGVSTAAALFALSLTACGGGADGGSASAAPSAPPADVTLALSASISQPVLSPSLSNEPMLTCSADLSVQATGVGTATVASLYFRYYDVRDSSSLATYTIEGADLQGAFGDGKIAAGATQRSTWDMTGPYSFAVELQARYRNGTTGNDYRLSDPVRFRCAPSSVDGAAVPTLTSVTVDPSSGALPADSVLKIAFTASTPAGALYSIVRITGPCVIDQRFVEQFQSSVSHSLTIPLSYPCQLGVPVGVDVLAFDATAVGSAQQQSYPVTLVDGQPPGLDVGFYPPHLSITYPLPSGDFVASDTMLVAVGAHDNYHVSAIVWEIYPFGTTDTLVLRDSAVAPDTGLYYGGRFYSKPLLLPLQAAWVGTKLQFRIRARDAEGAWSDELVTPQDSVRISASPAGGAGSDRLFASRAAHDASRAARIRATRASPIARGLPTGARVATGASSTATWPPSGGFRVVWVDPRRALPAGAARPDRRTH